MGHYVRLLSPCDRVPAVAALQSALRENGRSETLAAEGVNLANWTQLILSHADGPPIAAIERNPVVAGELGEKEIEEFPGEVNDAKPESAARWLGEYLPRVKCIYAFQILKGARTSDGWGAIDVVRKKIKSLVGGIIQADWEGFSNEEGYLILWQFSDTVKGLWWMAALQNEQWLTFQMDLENREHRAAFQRRRNPGRYQGRSARGIMTRAGCPVPLIWSSQHKRHSNRHQAATGSIAGNVREARHSACRPLSATQSRPTRRRNRDADTGPALVRSRR